MKLIISPIDINLFHSSQMKIIQERSFTFHILSPFFISFVCFLLKISFQEFFTLLSFDLFMWISFLFSLFFFIFVVVFFGFLTVFVI